MIRFLFHSYNDTAVRNVAQMYTAVRHLNEDSTPSTRNMYQSIEQWENMIAKIAETGDKFKVMSSGSV